MRDFKDFTEFRRSNDPVRYRNALGMIRAYGGSRVGRLSPNVRYLIVYVVDGDTWIVNLRKKVADHWNKCERAEEHRRTAQKVKRDRAQFFKESADNDLFALRNDAPKPKHKRGEFYRNENTLQKVLIDGLDCLPGQQDLF